MQNFWEYYNSCRYFYTQILAPVCRKFRLTYMELSVLLFLANHPEFDTASQIVKYRQLTKSHVSLALRELQQRGFLTGERRADDRRNIHLKLTEKAQPVIRSGQDAQKYFKASMFSDFSPEEIKIYEQFQNRIFHNLSSAAEE